MTINIDNLDVDIIAKMDGVHLPDKECLYKRSTQGNRIKIFNYPSGRYILHVYSKNDMNQSSYMITGIAGNSIVKHFGITEEY